MTEIHPFEHARMCLDELLVWIEKDVPPEQVKAFADDIRNTLTAQAAELSRLHAILNEVSGALEPFAKEAEIWGSNDAEILTVAYSDTCLHCGEKPYEARSDLEAKHLRAASSLSDRIKALNEK